MTNAPVAARGEQPLYSLTLFVSGASGLSARAIIETRAICESLPQDSYELAVVDVHLDPSIAIFHGVVATPTLLRVRPLPERRHVGSISLTGGVLAALDLPTKIVDAS